MKDIELDKLIKQGEFNKDKVMFKFFNDMSSFMLIQIIERIDYSIMCKCIYASNPDLIDLTFLYEINELSPYSLNIKDFKQAMKDKIFTITPN